MQLTPTVEGSMNPKIAVALATMQHSTTFLEAIKAGQERCDLRYPPQYAEAIDKLKAGVELAEREYKEHGTDTVPVSDYLDAIVEALGLVMNLDVNVKALHACAWASFQAGKAINDLLVKVADAAREAGVDVDSILDADKADMLARVGIVRA